MSARRSTHMVYLFEAGTSLALSKRDTATIGTTVNDTV